MAEYDITIKAKPWKQNGNADGMSRIPVTADKSSDSIDDELPKCLNRRSGTTDVKWAA
ncbi:hypothetical protein FBU30_010709, partial [Linnemannia zychae]